MTSDKGNQGPVGQLTSASNLGLPAPGPAHVTAPVVDRTTAPEVGPRAEMQRLSCMSRGAALSSPSSPVATTGPQCQSLGRGHAVGLNPGGLVRVQYVPLEDDSDSSDSESEALLMQKYGIRGL
ncbi:hypothetical protein GPECTOR_175g215 [Gonium pectorale]|uniref:Uncharacterized protein n=1 Tax=Gonium pectorale TaxID=33097 RepID=A0A150FXE5_GONPE|nr:hypothetical protein GPECTOR_175g215 [Gonium pectorale]|eukprot:KXZ42247.1 hypothetical protein GPECTOR_175g215 [Gonium pectorale]